MTIAIAIAVPEGIVLAADSRMTFPNPRGWPKIASDTVQKVFELGPAMAGTTFGWAFLNRRNINSLVQEFKARPKRKKSRGKKKASRSRKPSDMEAAVQGFIDFFEKQYEMHVQAGYDAPVPKEGHAVGFLIAAYDEKAVGHIFRCQIPGRRIEETFATTKPGASWSGQIDIISRLIKGFDPRFNRSKVPPEINAEIDKMEYIIYWARMTLQDAVDIALFLLQATLNMQRFSDGIVAFPGDMAGCGGPIDVLVLTPGRIDWVQRKNLFEGRNGFAGGRERPASYG